VRTPAGTIRSPTANSTSWPSWSPTRASPLPPTAAQRVWGDGWYGDERTVDVHVRQLRKKLGPSLPLTTVWGVGYRLA